MESIINKIKFGKNQEFDFVENLENREYVARLLVSFANSIGGELLIGAKANGKLIGCFPKLIKENIGSVLNEFGIQSLEFVLDEIKVGRHVLILLTIAKAKEKQKIVKKNKTVYYSRINCCIVVANKILLKKWKWEIENQTFLKDKHRDDILKIFIPNEKITLSYIYKVSNLNKSAIDRLVSELLYLNQIELFCIKDQVFYRLVK